MRRERLALVDVYSPVAIDEESTRQRNLAVTANTYTHVLTDETEIDYGRTFGGRGASGGPMAVAE